MLIRAGSSPVTSTNIGMWGSGCPPALGTGLRRFDSCHPDQYAGVVELADARDLKSRGTKHSVTVRARSPAPMPQLSMAKAMLYWPLAQ